MFPISFYLAALREAVAVICWVISNLSHVGLGVFTVSSAEILHEFCAAGLFIALYMAMSIITAKLTNTSKIRACKISVIVILILFAAYFLLDRIMVQAFIVFSIMVWLAIFITSIAFRERKLSVQNS
jgi:hypothetical protein